MNRRTGIKAAAGWGLFLGGCDAGRRQNGLTKDQAVATARRAIAGKVTLLDNNDPATGAEDGGRYVVPFVRRNPPGTRGPEYDARVTIDANTGEVLQFLVGS